jgi:two-component system response regulator TctD
MRLLIVEDDAALARGLLKVFRGDGLAVDHVGNGQDALDVVQMEPYSAIILDLGLPDLDGLTVLKRMRSMHVSAPILILTARDAMSDRVNGLDNGADDYLSKPFAVEELEARVRALIRRANGNPEPILVLGLLKLDRASGAAYLGDEVLDLTRRERSVLETLIARIGTVVPKARLNADVFDYDDAVSPNALEVYIGRLRRKLEGSGLEILTVRGLGYLLRQT